MMGKSWKYSKGHSSGFVPDYRHAVETTGESEGLGGLARGVTASEDSFAMKRKCISLNVEGYDGFSVPMQVLSLARMSRREKKNLELKLKAELEQVRRLQKKIDTVTLEAVIISPASEIRSSSEGPKKPPPESLNRVSSVPVAFGKKKAPPGRNGPQVKRNISGRFQPGKPAVPTSTSNAMVMKQCENLLTRLMSQQYSWVFNIPVDVVKLNIPDYFTVIKNPMDLGLVKKKLASGEYTSPLDFAADVRLTFSNAMTYNPSGNDVHLMADTLRKYFEVRWKPIEKKFQVATDVHAKASVPLLEPEIITPSPPLKKKKTVPTDASLLKPEEPVIQVMSVEEKQKLGFDLEENIEELPFSVLEFLKLQSKGKIVDGEMEVDMEALSNDALMYLRKQLDEHFENKQKNQSKAEPCEIELHNESGFSNCSVQPYKGNEQPDEDVDIIGGNNPPVSSFPPVEIDKDASHKNSKRCSPCSSSSDSGSSSSDSDSGSSSESECDSPKASVPRSNPKENLNSALSPDQKKSDPLGDSEPGKLCSTEMGNLGDSKMGNLGDSELGNAGDSELGNLGESELGSLGDSEPGNLGDSDIGNPSLTEAAQPELISPSKPVSTGGDGHQDGESAPAERPVSPEKQYRAAYLKNRFADTILKAREKALEKGEKRDPEKLQKEKEELERRKKEEKARLQAEATAAEEARRKAEQEAAAETKRKRELEREAARQALQMMEKTVDINENCQFMEDLEMLRTNADDEELPIFEEEASPELSQSGLGSFKLQGNPLEQLGLYMKMDDDFEEEEPEPPQKTPTPEQSNDVEEGEID